MRTISAIGVLWDCIGNYKWGLYIDETGLHSRKLTWNPIYGSALNERLCRPPLGFHVSLGDVVTEDALDKSIPTFRMIKISHMYVEAKGI